MYEIFIKKIEKSKMSLLYFQLNYTDLAQDMFQLVNHRAMVKTAEQAR
jgi:hypothetical protein